MKRSLILISLFMLAAITFLWSFGTQMKSINAQAQSRFQCSKGSINGRYGYQYQGNIAGSGPSILTGTITHSYDGKITGDITASFNGTIIPDIPILNGTFEVNDDCSGSVKFITPVSPMGITAKIVIVDRGEEYFLMNTDSGNLLGGTAKRID